MGNGKLIKTTGLHKFTTAIWRKIKISVAILVLITTTSCQKPHVNNKEINQKENTMKADQVKPKTAAASEFVTSPLRNRIRLELNAPMDQVWKLAGDPGRIPEYSVGLQKVEATVLRCSQ